MHSIEELGSNVPAFLAKLWKMVEDPETNDLICWSPNGSSFHIRDQARFARELLPLYYKHNNMASFVRQLNMYGFHKVVSIESGGLKVDRDDMEFAHQCFLRGHPYLIEHIKRKIPTNKSDDTRSANKPEHVTKVLSEVKSLKGRQDNVDSQLSAMKRENQVLWREVAILRQKHLKQQQIVNKLIQFLVSMVQTSRGSGIGIKRHYPLMLNDITHHETSKSSKVNGNINDGNSVSSNLSPSGPVIHELDPSDLLDDSAPVVGDETSAPVFDLSDAVSSSSVEVSVENNAPVNITTEPSEVVTSQEGNLNGTIIEDPSSGILMELVEECPLNTEVVMEQYIESPKQTKGKQKNSVFKGSKRRKSKVMPSMLKTPRQILNIKREKRDTEEPVNVNNFLEIMLPSLVHDSNNPMRAQDAEGGSFGEVIIPDQDAEGGSFGEVIIPDLIEDDADVNGQDQQSSLEAATDAAISAITNVAAAQAEASSSETEKDPNAVAGSGLASEKSLLDDSRGNAGSKDLTLACAGSADPYKCKEDLDAHLDNMQTDLDNLKELLKGEGYNLDANMLLGVCAAGLGIDALKLFGDDSLSYGIPLAEDNPERTERQNGTSDPLVSGSELTTYSSNLFDLADMSEFDDWEISSGPGSITSDINESLNTPLISAPSPGFSGSVGKRKKK